MVTDSLLAELFSTAPMDRIFSSSGQLQQMLRFEWALSAALEECSLVPHGSSAPLAELLQSEFLTEERALALSNAAAAAGNLAIPFVKLLTEAVSRQSAEAARFVHMGATSQDVLDTALVLQMREALASIEQDLDTTLLSCMQAARQYRTVIMPGRTWLQQGPPVTLGLKFAGHAAALAGCRTRLKESAKRALVLQFGGAVGTLASLGADGLKVSAALARRLELAEPVLPWHTHRDSLAEMATVLGLLTGTLGKIARDLSLCMQTEVGELFEPAGEGRGGSSTMPHKRNPVSSAVILSAATRVPPLVATMLAAMVQEHERGLGGWHAEWETLPQIFRLTAGALAQTLHTVQGLEVDEPRMRQNLELTHGLVFSEAVSTALAATMGRSAAHRLLEDASHRAVREHKNLQQSWPHCSIRRTTSAATTN
jgi:3-carboxy-cis,cis-muconate cycloisomerase